MCSHFRDLNSVTFSLNTRFISGQHGTQGYQIAANFPFGASDELNPTRNPIHAQGMSMPQLFR